MPAYAVEADLNLDATRLVELTDSAAAPNVKDAVLLARLETEAETIVNATIGGAVTLPFVTVPPIITFITASIWCYRIYRHREVMDIPKTVQDDYDMAMAMLAKIVDGTIKIDPVVANLAGVPEVESSCARGWTPRDLMD